MYDRCRSSLQSSLVQSAATRTHGLNSRPRASLLRSPVFRSVHRSAVVLESVNQSVTGSEKLFADAAQEDANGEDGSILAESSAIGSNLTQLENQHQNWTGEESMQDAVLRMLVDKYKPLRSGSIRTADQKLKDSLPHVRQSTASDLKPVKLESVHARPWRDIAETPLLPSTEGHRPWDTTFKAPSHTGTSIRLGNFSPSPTRPSAESDDSSERTRRTERELAKNQERARRLSHARESTLDYRLGLKDKGGQTRINPATLKGWNSFVEDRIEKARLSGQFDKVKGRGQPIVSLSEERNPFIAREEFLMNRIVQRNGAAPPWIEVQMELEAAVDGFRETLKTSWTRRAIRMLTMSPPASSLLTFTPSAVRSLRDREWEERERSYHDTAIANLNSLVRKYNAMAPYAVRRPSYVRDAELERAYHDCQDEILCGIEARSRAAARSEMQRTSIDGSGTLFGLWDLILQWLRVLVRRFTKAG